VVVVIGGGADGRLEEEAASFDRDGGCGNDADDNLDPERPPPKSEPKDIWLSRVLAASGCWITILRRSMMLSLGRGGVDKLNRAARECRS
jgi:hypothetical protein